MEFPGPVMMRLFHTWPSATPVTVTRWTPQGPARPGQCPVVAPAEGPDGLLREPQPDPASALPWNLLRDHMQGKNTTNSTRALKLPDGTSAAWYILTIIGIYGVIFLFRLASNILGKNDKPLEDIYYSNLTSKLKNKELQSKAAQRSAPTVDNRATPEPNQASTGPTHGDSGPQAGTQGIP
ncbi:small integral membrane protein 34 [Loxodonta africana]|uniref:small integral membrane protein 34 n=1 Tax=Loxodonta africana TaxID=9785 RepID=UPI0030CCC992